MSQRSQTVCITCGLAVGETPRLNRLPNGQTCPACQERALDAISPALPSSRANALLLDHETGVSRDGLHGAGDWDDPSARRGA